MGPPGPESVVTRPALHRRSVDALTPRQRTALAEALLFHSDPVVRAAASAAFEEVRRG